MHKLGNRLENLFYKASAYLDKYHWLALALIGIVYLFTRLFHLGITPAGMHIDETTAAYDAYCIAHYGTDRHGISYPFYFQNIANGQNSLYIYLAALLLRFLPYSVTIIRIPAVLCGAVCCIAMYFLARELTGSKKWALLGPLLVTITPYFMSYERWGLESPLLLSLIPVAFLYLIWSIKYDKVRYYILSGIWFGIVLYTYAVSYISIPLLLIGTCIYLIYLKKFCLRRWIALGIPLGVLATPLIIVQLINRRLISSFSFLCFDFVPFPDSRSGEISLLNIPKSLYFWACPFTNDGLTYNAFTEFGTVYRIMIPMILLGLGLCIYAFVKSIRSHEFRVESLILFFFLISYFFYFLLEDPTIGRSCQIFMPMILCCIIAMKQIYLWMTKFQLGSVVTFLLLGILFIYFLLYNNFYFRKQAEVYGFNTLFFSTELGDAVEKALCDYTTDADTRIYVENMYDEALPELSIGLYGQVSPENWDEGNFSSGRIIHHLPENLDPDEDAVYVLGTEWDHITDYMVSEWGFQVDYVSARYRIVHR